MNNWWIMQRVADYNREDLIRHAEQVRLANACGPRREARVSLEAIKKRVVDFASVVSGFVAW
jgi:hypothetical protein